MIRVVLADDHRIFLDGISVLLRDVEGIELAATAGNGREALRLIETLKPDVAILDINMPELDGIEVAKVVRRQVDNCKVLILTMSNKHSYIEKAREAGACGYILKNAGKEEFLLAIRKLAAGQNYFASEVMETLMMGRNTSQAMHDIELTEREMEVLRLVAKGLTAPEIAEKLFISEHTVKSHRKSLLSKTNSRNSVELVMFSMEHRLI